MKTYADANALVRLYLQLPGHERIREWIAGSEARKDWPLPITDLLRMEVTNAIQRMAFESRTSGQWRITPEAAAIGLADFYEHLAEGELLRRDDLTLREAEAEFDSLANRHTARHGFRTYDIIHVASAITLGCGRFVSFDNKANTLAKLAGLKAENP
jgi:predicted nucleic acid-binding protein